MPDARPSSASRAVSTTAAQASCWCRRTNRTSVLENPPRRESKPLPTFSEVLVRDIRLKRRIRYHYSPMKTIKLNQFQVVLLACVGLFIVSAIAFRFMPRLIKPVAKPYSTAEEAKRLQEEDRLLNQTADVEPAAEPLVLPEPTSAYFAGGDVLRGLGANWTFVSQQDQKMLSMSYISGTAPDRESVVRLIKNGKIGLVIEESRIVNRKMLDEALKSKDVKQTKAAGKTGYLVPMGGLEGGTALLLAGTSTVLLLQDADAANWPKELNPEVEMFVRTVNVP